MHLLCICYAVLAADVLEYLDRMDDDVASCVPVRFTAPGMGWRVTRTTLMPKHVAVWHLARIYQPVVGAFEYEEGLDI